MICQIQPSNRWSGLPGCSRKQNAGESVNIFKRNISKKLEEFFFLFWQMITVNASLFPSSITNSLIAVGNDGLQERDRMVRACIAIICELGKITGS